MFDWWNSLEFWRLMAITEAVVAVLAVPIGFSVYRRLREARRVSNEDPLTGLANKRLFDNVWEYNLALSRRDGRVISLLVIDLDGLKRINDKFGHESGNQVIVVAAEAICDSISRETDLAARIGGDEFAVVLYTSAMDGARAVAEKTLAHVRERSAACGLPVTASIGVLSYYPTREYVPTPASLFEIADKAMYKAKRAGGDRIYAVAEGVPSITTGAERL